MGELLRETTLLLNLVFTPRLEPVDPFPFDGDINPFKVLVVVDICALSEIFEGKFCHRFFIDIVSEQLLLVLEADKVDYVF